MTANAYAGPRHNAFYVVFSVVILCLIFFLMTRWHSVPRWLVATGTFSYTLYLVHFPLMMLQLSLFRPHVVSWGWMGHAALAFVALAITIAIALPLGHYVENRIWLRSLLSRRSAEPIYLRGNS